MEVRSVLSDTVRARAIGRAAVVVGLKYGFYPSTNNNGQHKNVIRAAAIGSTVTI
jgi:hypothetical protein